MSELDDAMDQHMAYLVLSENRPFSYRDFMHFEVDGKEHRMTHGTYRNKILKLKKDGLVELTYNAGTAFYTLRGHRFGKPMTPNHAGVCHSENDPISRLIADLPMDKAALHDIRLTFKIENIWSTLSSMHPEFPVQARSKDIFIPAWKIGGLLVRAAVHKTDTVSIMVASSLAPVAVDINGVIRLSNALTRVEERLAAVIDVDDYGNRSGNNSKAVALAADDDSGHGEVLTIPEQTEWTVTMWHFGADASVEYTGEKFSVTWDVGQNALIRAYAKEMKDNRRARIRLERQEYPRKTLAEAIEERLK
jgi:hypothetical protein